MSNIFKDASATRAAAAEVADLIKNTVGKTIGAAGCPIALEGDNVITKDGIRVFNKLAYENNHKELILNLVRQCSDKTNQEAGDGTTTVSLIAAGVLGEFSKINMSRKAAVKIKEGIDLSSKAVLQYLAKNTRTIEDEEKIKQIAVISSNGDDNIGSKIAEAFKLVGNDGNITVEEGKSLDPFSVEKTAGTVLQRGYTSPYFITNTKKELVEFDNPFILLVNEKISSINSLVNILEKVNKHGRPLLIIAEDYESEVTSLLALNKMRGMLKVAAIKAPGFGDRRAEMLEDYRILFGAHSVVCKDMPLKTLEELEAEDLGTAKKVIISKDKTVILNEDENGNSSMNINPALTERIEFLKARMQEADSEYDKEKLQERLGCLCGGIAVLKIGGATDAEVKERRDRVDDALNATKAAVAEGIIPGGGATLLYATRVIDELIEKTSDEDMKIGMNVFKNAIMLPIQQIIDNSGETSAVFIHQLLQQESTSYIYDVYNKTFVDAFEAGIIDPVKVTRIAIQNAASITGLIISSGGCIVSAPKKDNDNSDAGAGAMGGMGGMNPGMMGGF